MMRHVMIHVCKTSEADTMRKRTPNERKLSNVVSPTRLSKDIQLVFFARSINLERALWAQCLFELMVCVSSSVSCKSLYVQTALNDMSFDMHKETNKKGYCICPNLYQEAFKNHQRIVNSQQVHVSVASTGSTNAHRPHKESQHLNLKWHRVDPGKVRLNGGVVPGKQGADVG